ncbi:MFS transporter [Anaerosacchariphilus polymeriproducens]|uniref:MFS transporter n=1 Tax=Anaerosacchariphilus polymeriproducens TaxID=1812858 RepID=A0A371ASW2_9FIRM|nr:MFS transporter [Anaerosacchariphilus polymeriproducens]RDU22651.1 MFS transporter [Anaerosacchariphilus polymeriproducens]
MNNIKNERNMILLLFGRTISMFGSTMFLIILPLHVLGLTGSLKSSGIFFAVVNIPAIICTPFFGVVVEKLNRKYIIVFCDFMTTLLYIILFLSYNRKKSDIIILLIVSMIINLLSKIFEISSKVIFTEISTENTIEKYNGIRSFWDNGSALIAPVLGTYLYEFLGFQRVLLIIALTYLLSAIQECFIIYKAKEKRIHEKGEKFSKQLLSGMQFVYKQKNILYLFIIIMSLNFFIANNDEIINPGILIQKYNISDKYYGLSSTSAVFGSLIAGLFIFKNKIIDLKSHLKGLFIANSFFMIITAVLSITLYSFSNKVFFCFFIILQFFIGMITTCINVPLGSYLQTKVPLKFQGRFFALLSFFSSLFVPMGISYSGYLSLHIQADNTYIINNICVILIVVVLFSGNKIGILDSNK